MGGRADWTMSMLGGGQGRHVGRVSGERKRSWGGGIGRSSLEASENEAWVGG